MKSLQTFRESFRILRKNTPTRKRNGFTLVELIVVITILTILATIGFISVSGVLMSGRDAKRIADINIIVQSFGVNTVANKPIITGGTADTPNISIVGSGITMLGYYGNLNARLLASLNIFGNGLADSDGFQSYTYTYCPNNGKYQASALLEDNGSLAGNPILFSQAYALTQTGGYIYIKGNFTSTGGINSLIPDALVWTTTTPDGTGLRIIDGTGTLESGDTTSPPIAPMVPVPPITPDCTIGSSNIDQCNISV